MTGGDVQAVQPSQGTDDGEPVFGVGAKACPGPREGLVGETGKERQHECTKGVDPSKSHILVEPDVLDIAPHNEAAVEPGN